ncbi:MAG TPA: ribose-phosphate diphosphokinase, partial [Pseudonocardia sp.]
TVPVLTEAVSTQLSPDAVVVAPDLGAVKLAENVAKRLSRAMATVRKARFSGSSVRAVELVGDVADRPVLIVDDMISTGATIEAAMGILLDRGAVPDLTVAAVHGPLVPRATERLRALPLRRIFVTDSTGPPAHPLVDVCPIDALLADAVRRLHHGRQLDDLLLQV